MALPVQSILRSELLALLVSRVVLSEDEACLQLARRLDPAADPALTLDRGEPGFRSAVRDAAHALMQDGLVESRQEPGAGAQWRIVSLRDAADLPEEIPLTSAPYYSQAASVTLRANKYEKDRGARKRCIDHHGARCMVCDFDFEKTYGALGRGCVRVHHIVPLAQIQPGYVLDPVRDLRPVCPNCHYMLHRIEPAYGIEQLRLLLRRQTQG